MKKINLLLPAVIGNLSVIHHKEKAASGYIGLKGY